MTRSAWRYPNKVSMSHACLRFNRKPARISLDGPYDTAGYVEMQRQLTVLVPFVPVLIKVFLYIYIYRVSRTGYHVIQQLFTVVSNEHSHMSSASTFSTKSFARAAVPIFVSDTSSSTPHSMMSRHRIFYVYARYRTKGHIFDSPPPTLF